MVDDDQDRPHDEVSKYLGANLGAKITVIRWATCDSINLSNAVLYQGFEFPISVLEINLKGLWIAIKIY